jgi:hypothetical protein
MIVEKQTSDLTGILAETLRALARLDVESLEGIALRAEDLVRESRFGNLKLQIRISMERGTVEGEMGVLRRTLQVTSANLTFMRGLSSMPGNRLEYGRALANTSPTAEVEYGND